MDAGAGGHDPGTGHGSPDCAVATVAGLLVDCGFNSVAVAANGHLFGIVRRSDLLRALRDDATATGASIAP